LSASGFNLFVYGTLRTDGIAAELLADAGYIKAATVQGALYDIDGAYPALMLYGNSPVRGEIWRCPPDLLSQLDAYESVQHGLFRRVGVEVAGLPCWTYVAGPALASKLTRERLLPGGDWLERHAER
jgi:gamma-glutamylcyclotransferase (GGCT)/AIG2-like uncharacterized protein YtfP